MSEPVLVTRRLARYYRGRPAVADVSMTVRQGEIYGFLGPNGAGKTTTLRMILGLVRPSAGEIRLFGQDPRRAPRTLLRWVGALIENPGYYPHLSPAENLRIVQRLKGGGPPGEIGEVLELVGLRETDRTPAGRLSLGMKQRLGIAMALLGRPRLLILDEPVSALDPAGVREMRALFRHLVRDRGMTILLSSHLLHEVEQLATRVGVIRSGRLLAEAGVQELLRRGRPVLEVAVDRPEEAAALLRDRLGLAARVRVGDGQEGSGGTAPGLEVPVETIPPAEVNRILVEGGFAVSRLAPRVPTLEEVFLELTGGSRHG